MQQVTCVAIVGEVLGRSPESTQTNLNYILKRIEVCDGINSLVEVVKSKGISTSAAREYVIAIAAD